MPARNLAQHDRKWLNGYFIFLAATALVCAALVFLSPSESASAVLLGLSASRLAFVATFLIVAVFFVAISWLGWEQHKYWLIVEHFTQKLVTNRLGYFFLVFVLSLVAVVAFYLILLTTRFTDEFVLARLTRILPFSIWILAFSAATSVVAPKIRNAYRSVTWDRGFLLPALVAAVLLAAVAVLVGLTGFGLQADIIGWDTPGVPLLAMQVFFAWAGAGLLWGIVSTLQERLQLKLTNLDRWIAVALWLLAVMLWQAEPLKATYFSLAPRAPNFEFYPSSDAANLDISAQRLLMGDGFSPISEKPIYSFFLAISHALVGQDYLNLVGFQIFFLALFPVVLYLIAAQLHHRFSGMLLAIAVTLREANAIFLSGEINVSHSKLLMTDLPTALGVAGFVLLLIQWMRSDSRWLRWPLFVGAALGLLVLLRSQIILFLPVLLLVAWLKEKRAWKEKAIYSALLLGSFLLITLPWMWRNYVHTGVFGYSQPLQQIYIASQYSFTPGMPDSGDTQQGFASAMQFALANPGEVARFVITHFFHNEVSSLLALPMRFDLADNIESFYTLQPYWVGLEGRLWSECCSLSSYIDASPYWSQWDGQIPSEAWLPLVINLTLVAIGIGAAWKKVGVYTLIPLAVHGVYSLSVAVARVSGWRLILPVDWVLILFYCIGLGQLTLWAWGYFFGSETQKIKKAKRSKEKIPNWKKQSLAPIAATLLLAGLLMPVAELVIPKQLAGIDAVQSWNSSRLSEQIGLDIDAFLEQEDAVLLAGKAFYPQFYMANEGQPGGDSAFHIQPFSRFAFWLVGPITDRVALPISSSTEFPNATEVVVLGCQEETFVRAVAVVFPSGEAEHLIADDSDSFDCGEN